jgi:hypothetical protein
MDAVPVEPVVGVERNQPAVEVDDLDARLLDEARSNEVASMNCMMTG